MYFKFFLTGIKNILTNPSSAWETIDSENKNNNIIRDSFLFPLVLLVSVSSVAGSMLFTNTELSPVYSVFIGIKWFALLMITAYATALVLGEITFPLDLGKSFSVSFRLVVYSISPLMICLIFSQLFESMLFINILGFYGMYIFWTGAEKLLAPPQYKKTPLLIALSVALVIIYIVTSFVLNMLTDKIYYAIFS